MFIPTLFAITEIISLSWASVIALPSFFISFSISAFPTSIFSGLFSFLNHCLILLLASPVFTIFSQSLLGPFEAPEVKISIISPFWGIFSLFRTKAWHCPYRKCRLYPWFGCFYCCQREETWCFVFLNMGFIMQNAKCKMQNECVAKGDYLKWFSEENTIILHYALWIMHLIVYRALAR